NAKGMNRSSDVNGVTLGNITYGV
ncbi:hypothetical protein, partial [uncultured Gammaproteobacteria bacterium]